MSKPPHFKSPPSVEAVFEFAAPNSGTWTVDEFQTAIGGFLDITEYPQGSIKVSQEVNIAHEEGKAPEVESSKEFWEYIDYKNKDSTQVLRFGADRMSFHRLQPYNGFEELLPEVKKIWSSYQALVKPKSVPQIGLRFINRIELLPETTAQELSSYLSILPKNAFAKEGRSVRGILSQVQLSQDSTGHRAAIAVSTVQNEPTSPLVVLLNIQTRCLCDFAPDDEGIWSHFHSLREWKNELFLESLEEKCLTLFNQ